MNETLDELRRILLQLGVREDELTSDCRLRSDLGLDSTETAQLELEIEEQLRTEVDLWDKHDYSLAELAELVDRHAAQGTDARRAADGVRP
ncbi:hypothetical protein GCM10010399_30510 [Dactylosporangium fulvum]|uniref:Acyl carrier protein n=1 Tax=Dactylosporangium fulvum TaxID=53359 RepID=A0ABY5W7Q8_9ACTN|nr:hypothetical protein [Dactylosporangium fulvum]UWP85395.1 hypothetical protein Dfulv_14625 [Dactylosporangium fulvum]